jgi:hypothetical protein
MANIGGLYSQAFERGWTLMDVGGRLTRGLQNRLRSSVDVRSSSLSYAGVAASAMTANDSQVDRTDDTPATSDGLATPPCHRRSSEPFGSRSRSRVLYTGADKGATRAAADNCPLSIAIHHRSCP